MLKDGVGERGRRGLPGGMRKLLSFFFFLSKTKSNLMVFSARVKTKKQMKINRTTLNVKAVMRRTLSVNL